MGKACQACWRDWWSFGLDLSKHHSQSDLHSYCQGQNHSRLQHWIFVNCNESVDVWRINHATVTHSMRQQLNKVDCIQCLRWEEEFDFFLALDLLGSYVTAFTSIKEPLVQCPKCWKSQSRIVPVFRHLDVLKDFINQAAVRLKS